jgi:phosphoglycerate dehydrogenase-like enzyme
MNVLICDPISPKGIALFQSRPEFKVTVLDKPLKEAELIAIVKDVEAMVVRSETKVSRKASRPRRSCAWSDARAWALTTWTWTPPPNAAWW